AWVTSLSLVRGWEQNSVCVRSLHDALPIFAAGDQVEQRATVGQPIQRRRLARRHGGRDDARTQGDEEFQLLRQRDQRGGHQPGVDRESTRLNSSHVKISYAVFCLKKKSNKE